MGRLPVAWPMATRNPLVVSGDSFQADSRLLARFAQRDRRALAEIITRVESGDAPPLEIPEPAESAQRRMLVVGITGAGGAGKSTLVGALVKFLRSQNRTVAVLACDPSSPVSGGALLGDRVRVEISPDDEGVYFRSLATRGAQGGISAAVGKILPWLRAFGFDVILIETVGVGQDQVAARPLVDVLTLVITPNSGDSVQWDKAGLIELADVVVVNKSDQAGADQVAAQLVHSLSLGSGRAVEVLSTIATQSKGIEEWWRAVEGRRDSL